MKKRLLWFIIAFVSLLFFLLLGMRILRNRVGFYLQPQPRLALWRQWLEQRKSLKELPEELAPEEGQFPQNYWSHTELPTLTMAERLKLALQVKNNPEKYYQQANQQAQELSNKLEKYIRDWLVGETDAKLPQGLLPEYIDNPKTKDWILKKPDEVNPSEQWLIIPTHEIDPEYQKHYMLGADRHVTYGKLIFVAPIGSKLLIEGDFPHARFMNYEILEPFDPEHPATGTMGENPEVPIVDVDIEPDPGHTNPFRVGADRNAKNRHYHLTFEIQAGNSVKLNPQVMKSPEFRAPGNTRVGGPFGFAGPWGDGALTVSLLWLRIYAPDKGAGILGGVSLPKALLELPSGEKFWLQPDFSLAKERQLTQVPAGYQAPEEPFPFIGSHHGWFKIFGLALVRAENQGYRLSEPWGKQPLEKTKERIRKAFTLLFNRGVEATPPGNYEASATVCHYNSYLTRMFQRGPGKVYVITGKMPTTPKTKNGEPLMEKAQARYWSISQYGKGEDDKYETAVHYGGLMDDEIVLNENNEYIIVYSSPEDRPKNATAENGVTWQNWGPRARQTITIRWMSVQPDWYLPEYAPSEKNIPWQTGAWSATEYDETLVGQNQPGVMGPYHPLIHYLSKEEFEALGSNLTLEKIPLWK